MTMFRDDYKKANENISPSQELISNTAKLMKQELNKQLSKNNEISADSTDNSNSLKNHNKIIDINHRKNSKRSMNKYLLAAAGISFCLLSTYVINHYVKNDRIVTYLSDKEFVSDVELKDGNLSFDNDYVVPLENNDYLSTENIISKDYTVSEYIEYLGFDPKPSYIPSNIKDLTPNSQPLFTTNKDVIINDNYTFTYGNDDCSLKVTVSKDHLPKNSKTSSEPSSRINSTKLTTSFDSSTNEYFASFIYNSVGYNIQSKNISQKDFIKILLSIIKE